MQYYMSEISGKSFFHRLAVFTALWGSVRRAEIFCKLLSAFHDP
jgi:hypothetical protein